MIDLRISSFEQIVLKDGRPSPQFVTKWNILAGAKAKPVDSLPTNPVMGDTYYATDLCVFNGTGTQESTGNGTGGLVSFNGDNWVIVGTNVAASA